MLESNQAGRFTDLWALGCMIYQFINGLTPFHGESYNEVFMKIQNRRLKFPYGMDRDARDLVDKLLDMVPENRLGFRSFEDLKSHQFFKDIDFSLLAEKKLPNRLP